MEHNYDDWGWYVEIEDSHQTNEYTNREIVDEYDYYINNHNKNKNKKPANTFLYKVGTRTIISELCYILHSIISIYVFSVVTK